MLLCRLWGATTFQSRFVYAKAPWGHSGYPRAPKGARWNKESDLNAEGAFEYVFYQIFCQIWSQNIIILLHKYLWKGAFLAYERFKQGKAPFNVLYISRAPSQCTYHTWNVIILDGRLSKGWYAKKHFSTTTKCDTICSIWSTLYSKAPEGAHVRRTPKPLAELKRAPKNDPIIIILCILKAPLV